MNKSLLTSAIVASLISTADARMSFGACPKVSGVTTLDSAKYAGMWYLNEKDAMFPYGMMSECVYKKFTLDANGDMDLWFQAYDPMMFDYSGVGGKMYCTANSDPACQATMGSSDKRADIPILATDYENYDIGYYCMEMINALGLVVKADFVFISGREQNMSEEKLEEARQIVRDMVPEYSLDW